MTGTRRKDDAMCKKTEEAVKRYRREIIFFGVGLLWGVSLVLLGGVLFLRSNLIREKECALSYEETVRLFPQKVASVEGWTVRTVPCGQPVPEPGNRMTVFEICSRRHADRIFGDPASRKTAAVLPCKMAIYERDGKVYLARLNGGLFMRLLGGLPVEIFTDEIIPEQKRMLQGLLRE